MREGTAEHKEFRVQRSDSSIYDAVVVRQLPDGVVVRVGSLEFSIPSAVLPGRADLGVTLRISSLIGKSSSPQQRAMLQHEEEARQLEEEALKREQQRQAEEDERGRLEAEAKERVEAEARLRAEIEAQLRPVIEAELKSQIEPQRRVSEEASTEKDGRKESSSKKGRA